MSDKEKLEGFAEDMDDSEDTDTDDSSDDEEE